MLTTRAWFVKKLGPWQDRIRLIVHLRTVPAGAVVFYLQMRRYENRLIYQ